MPLAVGYRHLVMEQSITTDDRLLVLHDINKAMARVWDACLADGEFVTLIAGLGGVPRKLVKTLQSKATGETIVRSDIPCRRLTRALVRCLKLLSKKPDSVRKAEEALYDLYSQATRCHSGLVYKIASAYIARCDETQQDDIVQAGMMGLLKAIERYDPERGTKFSTYAAWWIRQAIQRHIDNTCSVIRVPVYVRTAIRKMRDDTPKDRLSKRALEAKRVEAVCYIEDNEYEVMGRLDPSVTDGTSVDDVVLNRLTAQQAVELMIWLTPREQRILEKRYGLNGSDPMSLQEVSELEGMSKERVRQIEKEALKKLRSMLNLHDDEDGSQLSLF